MSLIKVKKNSLRGILIDFITAENNSDLQQKLPQKLDDCPIHLPSNGELIDLRDQSRIFKKRRRFQVHQPTDGDGEFKNISSPKSRFDSHD